MSDFYKTILGRQFYEGTMPKLVKELEKLNANLSRLGKPQEAKPEKPSPHDIEGTLHAVEDALKYATPGPWTVGRIEPDEAHIDFPKGDKRIGFVRWTNAVTCWGSDEDHEGTGEVMRANAHLVSRAPEWLRLLVDEVKRLRAQEANRG